MKPKILTCLLIIPFLVACNTNQNNSLETPSEKHVERTNHTTSETQLETTTDQLERLYDDKNVEYGRVVANLGELGHIGYTKERVINNNISFIAEENPDNSKFITVKENGEPDRYIYYVPLGNGYIDHTGLKKYPSSPNAPMANTYLKTEYDEIALEILSNTSNKN